MKTAFAILTAALLTATASMAADSPSNAGAKQDNTPPATEEALAGKSGDSDPAPAPDTMKDADGNSAMPSSGSAPSTVGKSTTSDPAPPK